MTEPKFTPGPWFIKPMHSIVRKRENETDPWKRQYPFCVATMVEGDSKVKEANANLIAAAPEMYALLADIAKNYQCMPNPATVESRINTLLAKARGEQP